MRELRNEIGEEIVFIFAALFKEIRILFLDESKIIHSFIFRAIFTTLKLLQDFYTQT